MACLRRYSGRGRAGGSAADATTWVSESSVVCKAAAGGSGSVVAAVTSGEAVASMSEGLSYDAGAVSRGKMENQAASGGGSVSLTGSGLGTGR